MIDLASFLAEVERLCRLHCSAPLRIEIGSADGGQVELAVVGVEASWTSYAAGWQSLTDAVDEYVVRRGWRFQRGEWSLSWDGGAIAEWIITGDSDV